MALPFLGQEERMRIVTRVTCLGGDRDHNPHLLAKAEGEVDGPIAFTPCPRSSTGVETRHCPTPDPGEVVVCWAEGSNPGRKAEFKREMKRGKKTLRETVHYEGKLYEVWA